MNFLEFVPAELFEGLGIVAGLGASIALILQVIKELRSEEPSTLSMGYLIGWLMIFVFWGLYGVRFEKIAIWLTNAMAVVIQLTLLGVVLTKRKRVISK